MGRDLVAAMAAMALVGCGGPASPPTHDFTAGFKAGQTVEYRVHTKLTGTLALGDQQLPLDSDQVLTEQLATKTVDKAGVATVEVSTVALVDGATGAPATSLPPPVEITVTRDGRILSGAATPLAGRVPSIPGSDQLTPVLAGHPVKVGDRWSRDYSRSNPYGSGGFNFTADGRYLRDETLNGVRAAVVEVSLQGPIDFTIDFTRLPQPVQGTPSPLPSSPVHYTGTVNTTTRYWLDLGSSRLLKSSGSGSYALGYQLATLGPQSGAPQQVTFNGKITTETEKL